MWNYDSITKKIFNTFQLIHITILLKVNYSLYLIVIIVIILLVYFTCGLIVLMLFRIIRQKKTIKWPIKILQYILPFFSFGLYGQIYLLFTTVYYCRKKESNTSPYLKCRDDWFKNFKPFATLAMILHFLIAFITNTLYYQPSFIKCKTNLLQKSNSLPDVIFLFVKILIITIFILDKGEENEHWAILCYLIVITGVNAYFTLFYQNRKNKIFLYLNNIFSLILLSGFLILLIGKIINYWNFNGTLFLFTSLTLIIIIFFIFYKASTPQFILIDYRSIRNPDRYLQYVIQFYDFIRNKNKSRDYLIIMRSLISTMEKDCTDIECPLNKYLNNLKKGVDSEYFLLQFVENLYQYGIKKFRGNIFLKNYYSSFLIMEMNNKKKALIEMNDIKNKVVSLQMNYSIFRCQKIIDNYSSPFINKNNSIFNYRTNVQDLRNNIENISLLYFNFISLLLEKKLDNVDNFEKIAAVGYKIKKLLKKTENSLNKIINVKIDNFEIIKLYSEFAENILNDEEKIEKSKNYLKIKSTNNIIEIQEKDYSNFNLEILKESDNFYYLIILTKNKGLGIISDCSKNLCNLLGYTKNELIGKHINLLLPKIFHDKHLEFIKQKSEEDKSNFFEKLYTNSIYSPNFLEKEIFCLSKSKLLIPLSIKIYLVNNEENELVYIAEFTRKLNFTNDLLKKINIGETTKYCVLTDKNFIVQSFTLNCLNFLKFKYQDIGSNYNLLNSIKQFRQDYISAIQASTINRYSHTANTGIFSMKENSNELKLYSHNYNYNYNINNKGGIADIKKMKLKKDLFNKKYFKKCKVTWSHCDDNYIYSTKIMQKYYHFKNSLINADSIISFDEFKLLNQYELELYMEAKEIILGNELIGYYFYFTNLCNPKPSEFFNYKIEKNEENNDNFSDKECNMKFKKYQVTFKTQKFLEGKKRMEDGSYKRNDGSNSISFNREMEDLTKTKYKRKSEGVPKIKFRRKSSKTFIKWNNASENVIVNTNNKDDFIVNGDYVPNAPFHFEFDHNEGVYIPSISSGKEKLEYLQKDAEEKMNLIIKIKFEKKKKVNRLFNDSESDTESKEESPESSSSIFTRSNIYSECPSPKSIKKKFSIEKKNRGDKKVGNIIFNLKRKSDEIDSAFLGRSKVQLKKMLRRSTISIKDNDFYNYYKANTKNVRLWIYNFQKEMIEEKPHNSFSEIETIIYNLKKGKPLEIGADEDYPNMIIKNSKDDKSEGNSEKRKKIQIVDKDKIFKRKIVEAINNYKDEAPMKKLKFLLFISFIMMVAYGLLNFFFNMNYYSTFQSLISLIQSSLNLKYCNLVSVFYIRELILLNFNINEIPGGSYTQFPANNKNNYLSYLQSKLVQLYIENHSHVKTVFGTAYKFSKNSSYYLNEEIFDVKFLTADNQIMTARYDMKKIILAYNTAFSNLAMLNNSLEQNHSDIFNYLHNSFKEFEIGFDTLYDVFYYELELMKKSIKTYIYIIIAVTFLSYSLLYYFGLKYFVSSNLIRISYIKIFYSINSKTLKDLMKNCLNLIKKFKTNQKTESGFDEEGEDENKLMSKNDIIKFNENTENNSNEVENFQKGQNIYFSYLSLLFLTIFFFFILFLFCYFIFISKHFYDLYKSSIEIANFSKYFLEYQLEAIKIYNVYREFIFDNTSLISDLTPYDYLITEEKQMLSKLRKSNSIANPILGKMIQNNENGVREMFNLDYCSFEIIEYFNLTNECINKFGSFSKFALDNVILYFLEELRLKKNIIKYILNNFNVVGNLTEYNKEEMINIYNQNSNNNKTIFRLDLFNNQIIHSDLNFMYFNIIFQSLQQSRVIISFFNINGENSFFILLIIIYILVSFIIIISFFIPMIKYLNKQIYKAKNILSIVPINVLIYQTNNRKLFKFFND